MCVAESVPHTASSGNALAAVLLCVVTQDKNSKCMQQFRIHDIIVQTQKNMNQLSSILIYCYSFRGYS